MDQKPKLMTPFDMLVTSSSLYTLKLMLPFAPASIQRSLAIYIKFSELKATMEHFYGFLNTDHPGSVLEMEDLMNMMEMMQTMNSDSDGENGFSPMDFMKGVFNNE